MQTQQPQPSVFSKPPIRPTVRLVYVAGPDGNLTRSLQHSSGKVFLDGVWAHTEARVVDRPEVFHRWQDVPEGWAGVRPVWP